VPCLLKVPNGAIEAAAANSPLIGASPSVDRGISDFLRADGRLAGCGFCDGYADIDGAFLWLLYGRLGKRHSLSRGRSLRILDLAVAAPEDVGESRLALIELSLS